MIGDRWWLLALLALGCHRAPDDRIIATGTIEVTEVDVAPIVPARVLRVLVDDGTMVRAGDTIAVLTQSTTRADIAQGEARLRGAEASWREALAGPRSREVDRARAELALAEAEAQRATRDLERTRPLVEHGAVSPQAFDAARTAAEAAVARRDAAREALELLREGTRRERIQGARAEVEAARASLAAVEAMAGDLVLLAPVEAVVLSRNAEPGEMLAAGQPAVTLGEVARPYVRVYVPTRELPRVEVGQSATAVLDGFPNRPFAGKVIAINPQAEFTPRIALTERERADLVFGVKVALADSTGMLKPGLPATVEIQATPS